jgi:two-component system NarL family sensor kinase
MPDSRRRAVATVLFVLAGALAVLTVGGAAAVGLDWAELVSSYAVTNAVIGMASAPCGLLIARARPRNPVGWLFLVVSLAHLSSAACVPYFARGLEAGWPEPALRLLITVFMFCWGWGIFVALPLALQLFPDGRPVGPRWSWAVWVTLLCGVLGSYGTGPTPDMGASSYLIPPGHQFVEDNLLPLTVVVWPLTVASLIVRFIRGGAELRRQLLWIMLAVLVAVGVNIPWAFSLHSGNEILLILAFPLIPIAATIAVIRSSLFDVRLAVSRVLVYEILAAAVFGAYLLLVALLERLLRGSGAPVLAALVIALAFNPARLRLQRLIDRGLYGAAGDPLRAVSSIGQRLTSASLESVLDGLREVLRLPYAAIEIGDHRVASSGEPRRILHATPLVYGEDVLGSLVVAARSGEAALPQRDRAVLQLLAGPLTIAVRATSLSEALRESRQRLVETAEEERRRLSRELHDMLGPVLTGAALTADGLVLSARVNAERAERMAADLSRQLRQAIGEVRRIVYGLRPPVLDEFGLVGALRLHADQLPDLGIDVQAPERLPTLPASVEVAAYRIATEAITNVVRHAAATQAVVDLSADEGELHVTVTDDGRSTREWAPGVGLSSIRERAAEVGGSCEVGPTPSGGRVAVVLPLMRAS